MTSVDGLHGAPQPKVTTAERADYARRLAEDWAGDCIKAGYVTTGAHSHKTMSDAINALAAAQAPAPVPADAIERAARAMAVASGWSGWDTAKTVADTPNGNEPDEERDHWRDMARAALAAAQATAVKAGDVDALLISWAESVGVKLIPGLSGDSLTQAPVLARQLRTLIHSAISHVSVQESAQ